MTILQIIGWWALASCTLGAGVTWLFFYGERRARDREHSAPADNVIPFHRRQSFQ